MKKYQLFTVDAFTDQPLAGNSCAVVFEADDLSSEEMLAIAREMNLSETAFVLKSDKADFAARYFTPAEEIPLAGHPTIATVYSLVDSGRLNAQSDTTISLELPAGVISVDIEVAAGQVERIVMSQKKPQFMTLHCADEILPVFGLGREDLLDGMPIQTVSTGTPQLMIPLQGQQSLRKVVMDVVAYNKLRASSDFFSPHLFCLGGVDKGATFARHMGVPPDVREDPFTGSATGGMAAYLWHYGLIDSPKFIAEQGHWMERPGQAFVEVVGPRDNIETVRVGGAAVVVIRGELAF